MLAHITPKTRLIIVNSPTNPCGGVVSAEEVKRLVAGLARHPNVVILSDEIYSLMFTASARTRASCAIPRSATG